MDDLVSDVFEADAMTEEYHWFERGVQFANTYFPWILKNNARMRKKVHTYFTQEYLDTLVFTGLDVEPSDILRFAYLSAFLSFLAFLCLDFIVLAAYHASLRDIDAMTILFMVVPLVVVPFLLMNLIAAYPKTYAKYLKIRSLGDIPEILSYLVMYLKLVPNLENSIRFAASESSTVLAWDLRKLMWDIEIRVYAGVDEAMTHFATRWGRYSDYFKRSLHLIHSSIQQHDEASRTMTLDRALDVSLEGTKETMNLFANRLHQPTVILYSVGIMIPLSLIAMLPAAGLVGMHVSIFQVFFIYDVVLPLCIFMYTRNILLSRPVAFNPPRIPSHHPDVVAINKRRWLALSMLIGALTALPGAIFLLAPLFLSSSSSTDIFDYIVDPQGLSTVVPTTLFFIWGVALALTVYCQNVYRPFKKIRDGIKDIEKEFSDALYILGKRISEEKSPEESFLYAAQTMEGSRIAEVFHQTSFNLTAMHSNLYDALFDREFGSLAHVYSDRVKAILRLFVEGIQKSQRAVSVSLIRIADHLKQLQEVERKINDMLGELTTTLRSTMTVFAPLIAGVTLAITALISRIIASLSGVIPQDMSGLPPTLSSVSSAFTLENVRPEYFILVIGIYLLELVVLLTRFTNGISEGDDTTMYMYSLGRTVPLAVIVFSCTIIVGQFFFSQLLSST
jgi:hypothetical protein